MVKFGLAVFQQPLPDIREGIITVVCSFESRVSIPDDRLPIKPQEKDAKVKIPDIKSPLAPKERQVFLDIDFV